MSPLQRSDFHTRESRRKILQDEFGFWCHCNLCEDFTDDEKNLEVNDMTKIQRKKRINWITRNARSLKNKSMNLSNLYFAMNLNRLFDI